MILLMDDVGDECDNEWGEMSDADSDDDDEDDDDDSRRCTFGEFGKVWEL